MLGGARQELRRVRQEGRVARQQQAKQGTRPRRQRGTHDTVSFGTVNATTAEKLRQELVLGGDLARCDFLGVQETSIPEHELSNMTD